MTGLVGWWPLHEDSGNTAHDLSGNGNHGTLNGGIVQGVAGKGGLTAYSFDGSDDYIDLPNFETFSSYTVSAWVKNTESSVSDQKRIVNIGQNNEIQIAVNSNVEDYQLQHYDGSNFHNFYYTLQEDWTLLTLTWDGQTLKGYANGESIGSASVSSMGTFNRSDSIAQRGDNSKFFQGNVTDVRVYNRALTSQEIKTLYDWGNGDYARPLNSQNSSSAVSRYALDGDAVDSWSSNDGTMNGGLSFTDNAIRGQAANFDGSNDYITFSDSGDESTWYPSELTVSAWVRPDNSNNWARIISGGGSLDGSTSDAWALQRIDSSNHAFGIRVNGTYYNAETPDNLPAGEWSHVCGTYDGDKIKFYTNGSLRDVNRSPSGHIEKRTNPILIGRRASSEYYSGLVDDVRIYDRALRPEEVFELYRWGTGGRDLRKFTVNSRGL